MSTENISVLEQFNESSSISVSPSFALANLSDPSSVPEHVTPIQLTAPDGSPVTADAIFINVSSKNSDGTYANVTETIEPIKVLNGTQAQLPTPQPVAGSHGVVTIPGYQFYQYQTIEQDAGGGALNSFLDSAEAAGADAYHSGIDFIHHHINLYQQTGESLAQTPEFQSEAELLSGEHLTRHLLIDAAITFAGGAIAAGGAPEVGLVVSAYGVLKAVGEVTGGSPSEYFTNHLNSYAHQIKEFF